MSRQLNCEVGHHFRPLQQQQYSSRAINSHSVLYDNPVQGRRKHLLPTQPKIGRDFEEFPYRTQQSWTKQVAYRTRAETPDGSEPHPCSSGRSHRAHVKWEEQQAVI